MSSLSLAVFRWEIPIRLSSNNAAKSLHSIITIEQIEVACTLTKLCSHTECNNVLVFRLNTEFTTGNIISTKNYDPAHESMSISTFAMHNGIREMEFDKLVSLSFVIISSL